MERVFRGLILVEGFVCILNDKVGLYDRSYGFDYSVLFGVRSQGSGQNSVGVTGM